MIAADAETRWVARSTASGSEQRLWLATTEAA
jgi:hypothetical protein